jgi:hypothetical protein
MVAMVPHPTASVRCEKSDDSYATLPAALAIREKLYKISVTLCLEHLKGGRYQRKM